MWGGEKIRGLRGEEVPTGPIGESWDIADQDRGMSVVAEGALQGKTLRELVEIAGTELVGTSHDGGDFPLLIKLIDANDRLSVQVHPDDALAQKLGVGQRGKTECWYMIGDGGELYQGTAPGVDRAAFAKAIEDDTVAETVNRFETNDGDFFFMPARTVHALGKDCLLYEIQQSCDCTFRVYDWGRMGLDGKPRELHVEQLPETMDYAQGNNGPVPTSPAELADGGTERQLVTCPYFDVAERAGTTITGGSTESCSVVICLEGTGTLSTAGGSIAMEPYRSYLVPAVAGAWRARKRRWGFEESQPWSQKSPQLTAGYQIPHLF